MVRLIGLEPTRRGTLDPKSSASTNSATSALSECKINNKRWNGQILKTFYWEFGRNGLYPSSSLIFSICQAKMFSEAIGLYPSSSLIFSICQAKMFSETIGLYIPSSLIFSICQARMFSETIGLYTSSSLIFSICQARMFAEAIGLYISSSFIFSICQARMFSGANWALYIILFHPNTLALR